MDIEAVSVRHFRFKRHTQPMVCFPRKSWHVKGSCEKQKQTKKTSILAVPLAHTTSRKQTPLVQGGSRGI
jgi:hypothetical protein